VRRPLRGARAAAGVALGLLGSLVLANPGATAPPESDEAFTQVLQLLAARRHGHVSFTEVHTLAMLERPLESSGELFYDAPDRLEKRTLKPKAEDLLLDKGMLRAQRGTHVRVLSLRDYPQALPFVESLRATLAGDRAALERYFTVTFAGTPDHWTLELAPTDSTLARSVQQVRIVGERDRLSTVEIREADGDSSLLSLGPELNP
jgi:outer membrane lipoprotein carrier protein LolA